MLVDTEKNIILKSEGFGLILLIMIALRILMLVLELLEENFLCADYLSVGLSIYR